MKRFTGIGGIFFTRATPMPARPFPLFLLALLCVVHGCSKSDHGTASAGPTVAATLAFGKPSGMLAGVGEGPSDPWSEVNGVISAELKTLQSPGFSERFAKSLDASLARRLAPDVAGRIGQTIRVRRIPDSRLVELGIALDDPVLATALCRELLRFYLEDRGTRMRPVESEGASIGRQREPDGPGALSGRPDLRVVDGCSKRRTSGDARE